jgi:hypothetical protein
MLRLTYLRTMQCGSAMAHAAPRQQRSQERQGDGETFHSSMPSGSGSTSTMLWGNWENEVTGDSLCAASSNEPAGASANRQRMCPRCLLQTALLASLAHAKPRLIAFAHRKGMVALVCSGQSPGCADQQAPGAANAGWRDALTLKLSS